MVGDSKIRGPRTEVGGHVGALPDGSMTSYDAPGRVGLHWTASDDVTRAARASSAPRRSSTSVTELGIRPHQASSSVTGGGSVV
ncbi:hypothetical protein MJG53_002458 [Ovis ammon polii x Ovis aries]|uniref:Uncharacterized protein n=2 Tax=Ovis TaxID=9935 RepID=A0A836AEJ6_SHEEP|nr:hypothetical protein JEQ12_010071 [Ovis aries]KAI4588050.1 hypothetical protein MJG53_002458 [Ovis ammon polii x Ovis aries]